MSAVGMMPTVDRRQFLGASLVAGAAVLAPAAASASARDKGRLYIADQSFRQSFALLEAATQAGAALVEPQAFIDNRWLMDAAPVAANFSQVTGLTTYGDRHLMVDALHRAGFVLRHEKRITQCQRTHMCGPESAALNFGPTSELWYWDVSKG